MSDMSDMKDKNTDYIFLGAFTRRSEESSVGQLKLTYSSNAPNVFQRSLTDGLAGHLGDSLTVMNVLPVGTWPGHYKKLFLGSRDWKEGNMHGRETGGINLPFLKQISRAVMTKRFLKKNLRDRTEIIVYSAYLPFLRAACAVAGKNAKITAIITDLPEYYDFQKTSFLFGILRKIQNRAIYRCLAHIDRFVVLTKQMTLPLAVGKRPWLCVEGICTADAAQTEDAETVPGSVLYTGAIHEKFGILNLLAAFELTDRQDISLWICGSGDAEKYVKAAAERDPRIRFFGFCDLETVGRLRAKAAVLVNPRTNEGEYTKYSFPSKTMEYMASGKPVVMYRLDGIPEEYDRYLFYVSPGDPAKMLLEAITKVVDNYGEAETRGREARRFVLENKNAAVQAERIIDFIRSNP